MIGLWPMPGSPVCAAAKAGAVNFSRSLEYLAEESGIRVNTICPVCPEIVDTPLIAVLGGDVLADARQKDGLLRPDQIAGDGGHHGRRPGIHHVDLGVGWNRDPHGPMSLAGELGE